MENASSQNSSPKSRGESNRHLGLEKKLTPIGKIVIIAVLASAIIFIPSRIPIKNVIPNKNNESTKNTESVNNGEVITFRNINFTIPSKSLTNFNEGCAALDSGRYDDAITYLRSSLLMNGSDSASNALLKGLIGESYFKKGDYRQAEEYLRRSYDDCPVKCFCRLLGDLYEILSKRTNNLKQKIEFLEKSIFYYKQASLLVANKGTHLYKEYVLEQNFAPICQVQKTLHSSKVYALCIGLDRYSDESISKLSYAEKDAKSVSSALRKTFSDRFEIVTLIGRDATKSSILENIRRIRGNIRREDQLILYFAGHCIIDERRIGSATVCDRYILPSDVVLDNLENTAISLRDLYLNLNTIPLENSALLILDACTTARGRIDYYSGTNRVLAEYKYPVSWEPRHCDNKTSNLLAGMKMSIFRHFEQEVSNSGNKFRPLEIQPIVSKIGAGQVVGDRTAYSQTYVRNKIAVDFVQEYDDSSTITPMPHTCWKPVTTYAPFTVLSSSSLGERSGESSTLKQGIFTYFFLKALTNLRDLDHDCDSQVSVGELYANIRESVVTYCNTRNLKQTPALEIYPSLSNAKIKR